MSLVDKLRSDLLQSRKEKDEIRSNILRVVLGEVELIQAKTGVALPDEKVCQIIRRIVESNSSVLGLSIKDNSATILEKENNILIEYLPINLSIQQIRELISQELIEEIKSSSPRDLGKLTGKVIRIVKESGKTADGNDVRSVIISIGEDNVY